MKYPELNKERNNIDHLCIASVLTQLTNERIRTLRQWSEGAEDSDACIGSIKMKTDISHNIPHIIYIVEEDSCSWIKPPKGLKIQSDGLTKKDYERNGKIDVVLFDLNSDGSPEYFVKLPCGNGGCSYYIIDGNTLRSLGEIFGAPIVIIEGKRYGYLSMFAYSHQSANSGYLTIYEYNGGEYQITRSVEIKGDAATKVFDLINDYSKTK